MREARRHHRLTCGDRLNQDAGGDLLQRVVRQQHDIGGADQLAQGSRGQEPAIEVHAIFHVPGPRPGHQRPPIGLAVAPQHARMCLTGHLVVDMQPALAEQGHRIDGMLNPLARPKQPPGQYHGPARLGRWCGSSMVGRTVRYHDDLLSGGAVDIKQSRPGRPRHRHHHASGGDDVVEDHALPWRRLRQDRVQIPRCLVRAGLRAAKRRPGRQGRHKCRTRAARSPHRNR